MEIILIIAIIIFIIWIFSSSNSSNSNTSKQNNFSLSDYENEYNYSLKVQEDRQSEEVKQNKNDKEEFGEEQTENISQLQKKQRINLIVNQDKAPSKEIVLDRYGIEYFYHMTHKNNLKSILQYGLYSHNKAYSMGLNNKEISNNEVIQIRSQKREPINGLYINDYAPLYINPKNPMLYVRKNIEKDIVIIGFDRSVIYLKNSIFTDGNAANKPTKFYNSINDLGKLNWNCLNAEYWTDYIDGTRIRMAEVLVKELIPNTKIRKLFCCHPETLSFAKSLISNLEYIDVEINPKYFFNVYQTDNFFNNFDLEDLI